MRTLLNEPWAIAMILPQIIHEEPCRGAMELKGKVGGGVGWGGARKASRSGPQPEWSEGWEVRGGETGRDPSDKCVWNRKEIPHYLQRWQACVCVHICACVCICMCLFLESHLCYYIWKKRHCGSVSGVHHNRGMCVRFLWRHALFVCVCVCALETWWSEFRFLWQPRSPKCSTVQVFFCLLLKPRGLWTNRANY